jgi:hypothetical protein
MGTNIAPKVLIILFTAALQKDRPATIFVRRGAHHVSGWRILGVEQEVAWETNTRDLGRGIPRDLAHPHGGRRTVGLFSIYMGVLP